jgi:hypothetical protein
MSYTYPVYCRTCRKQIAEGFEFCPHCGASQQKHQPAPAQPIPPPRPQRSPAGPPAPAHSAPQSFATVDYRYLPCPGCGKPVQRPRRGNPPRGACDACGTSFLVDRRGGIPVICPNCSSTSVTGGGFPFWSLIFGMPGIMLAETQPTKYVCQSCDCHFIGVPGANMVFGFFIS